MVHKPKHKVHSFRGLLGDGGQDEISLERQNVNLAYRITKFEVLGPDAATNMRQVIKIYRESQSSVTTTINFSDPDLLGAAVLEDYDALATGASTIVTFDNVLFSRNIFVNSKGHTDTPSVNYYIEIEEVPVAASTLMQIKLGSARKLISGSMGK